MNYEANNLPKLDEIYCVESCKKRLKKFTAKSNKNRLIVTFKIQ
jgi:hypothetical protein